MARVSTVEGPSHAQVWSEGNDHGQLSVDVAQVAPVEWVGQCFRQFVVPHSLAG